MLPLQEASRAGPTCDWSPASHAALSPALRLHAHTHNSGHFSLAPQCIPHAACPLWCPRSLNCPRPAGKGGSNPILGDPTAPSTLPHTLQGPDRVTPEVQRLFASLPGPQRPDEPFPEPEADSDTTALPPPPTSLTGRRGAANTRARNTRRTPLLGGKGLPFLFLKKEKVLHSRFSPNNSLETT